VPPPGTTSAPPPTRLVERSTKREVAGAENPCGNSPPLLPGVRDAVFLARRASNATPGYHPELRQLLYGPHWIRSRETDAWIARGPNWTAGATQASDYCSHHRHSGFSLCWFPREDRGSFEGFRAGGSVASARYCLRLWLRCGHGCILAGNEGIMAIRTKASIRTTGSNGFHRRQGKCVARGFIPRADHGAAPARRAALYRVRLAARQSGPRHRRHARETVRGVLFEDTADGHQGHKEKVGDIGPNGRIRTVTRHGAEFCPPTTLLYAFGSAGGKYEIRNVEKQKAKEIHAWRPGVRRALLGIGPHVPRPSHDRSRPVPRGGRRGSSREGWWARRSGPGRRPFPPRCP